MNRVAVFARDGAGGSPTAVGEHAAPDCLERGRVEGATLRIFPPRGELPCGVNAPLALGPGRYAMKGGAVDVHAEDALRWARVAPVALGSWVQPAFAARALSLSPLDLDGAHLAQAVDVGGVPVLLVPVERDALARARLAQRRMEELVLRQRFDIVVPFARSTSGGFDARFLAEPLGIVEDPASGIGGAALAAWLGEEGVREATITSGEALGRPSRMHVRTGAGAVGVGGTVVATG
ncbi:MAG: PhzF family phenazine biosynthesis protein [Thermoplasmatota archaeon]